MDTVLRGRNLQIARDRTGQKSPAGRKRRLVRREAEAVSGGSFCFGLIGAKTKGAAEVQRWPDGNP